MWVLEHLNKWATDFSPLIQLLMLLAVSGATITALWATWKSRKDTKVQVEYRCEISSIFMPKSVGSDGVAQYERSHECVSATLTNIGLRPTSVPWLSFGLLVPSGTKTALLNPVTDYRADAPLPFTPGECKTFELRSPDQLREEILECAPRWFPRLRIRRLRLTFATDGGDVFKAKIGKTLRAHINETAAQTNWIYQRQKAHTSETSAK